MQNTRNDVKPTELTVDGKKNALKTIPMSDMNHIIIFHLMHYFEIHFSALFFLQVNGGVGHAKSVALI